MRVAVVVPFCREPRDQLTQCFGSVWAQSHPCELIAVNDGGPECPDVENIRLPKPHGDFGHCARAVGAMHAIASGFDAVAFLDADNWWDAAHVEQMVALQRATGAHVCTASLNLVRFDGSYLGRCTLTDGEQHADSSGFFFTRPAFSLLANWALIPRELTGVGDRLFFAMMRSSGVKRAHNPWPTVFYRTRYAGHYVENGEPPPVDVKPPPSVPIGDHEIKALASRVRLVVEPNR